MKDPIKGTITITENISYTKYAIGPHLGLVQFGLI